MDCVLHPWESLATELIELIFSYLHGREIALMSMVCRRLARIVTASRKLQFKIELYIQGLAEDPHVRPTDLSAAIDTLELYKRTWNELQFPRKCLRVFEFDNGQQVYPSGRYFVDLSADDAVARIATIPDTGLDVVWRELPMGTVGAQDRQYSTVGLQGLNMLIVLGVERITDDGYVLLSTTLASAKALNTSVRRLFVPKISLLNAETFEPHRLPTNHVLKWPEDAAPITDVNWEQVCISMSSSADPLILLSKMGLSGRSLAVTLHRGRVCVWDWVTGTVLLRHDQPLSSNWTLMTERVFASTELQRNKRLIIRSSAFDTDGKITPLGSWAFPRVAADAFIADVVITTDDVDELVPEHKLDSRFAFAPSTNGYAYGTEEGGMSDSIMAVTITVLYHEPPGMVNTQGSSFTFYVFRSTFLTPQDNPEEILEWEAWGPKQARAIRGEAHCIRGCRAVHGFGDTHEDSFTGVLTFTPTLCRVAGQDVQPSLPRIPSHPRGMPIRTPSIIANSLVLENPVETSLPYILATSPSVELLGDMITVPNTAMNWWEDGRIVWNDHTQNSVSVVTL